MKRWDGILKNPRKFLDSEDFARQLRARTLYMVHRAKASHVGSCFSIADILAVLYGKVLRFDPLNPQCLERDRVILSKGHGAAIFYATLSACGYFSDKWLDRYGDNGSELAGHVTYGVPGVEFSAGALGHGLPVGVGMALAAKRDGRRSRVFVLMSDGECDEGSVWEAALLAPQLELENLMVVIDYNKIQSFGRVKDVVDLEPLTDKWKAFRWNVVRVDGHDHEALNQAFNLRVTKTPTVIIADTVKGKGVSFMEDKLEWHYKYPNEEQLVKALVEVGGSA